ncbi:MAG: response regulator [Thermodesulfobacteriota bacterium]
MALILLIDDDDQLRRMVKRVLEKEGHEVLEAPDGRDINALCGEHPVDLIITDVLMPHKDGLDILLEIRQAFPRMKVVVISGGGPSMPSGGCLHLAVDLGADAVIEKPISKKQLLEVVNGLVGT